MKVREVFTFSEVEWDLEHKGNEEGQDIIFWEFKDPPSGVQPRTLYCHVFVLSSRFVDKLTAKFGWEKHEFQDFTCLHAPYGAARVLSELWEYEHELTT